MFFSVFQEKNNTPDDEDIVQDLDNRIVELLPLTAGYESAHEAMEDDTNKKNGGWEKMDEENMPYLERPESERNPSFSDPDIRCSYFRYSPDFLQYWNNPKSLLFFLCCLSMVQGKKIIKYTNFLYRQNYVVSSNPVQGDLYNIMR